MIPMTKITIYTDGACRGNPGPSAIAFLILDNEGEILEEHSEYVGIGTNNEAEYKALISALQKAKDFGEEIEVYSDSNLVVNQMNGHWRINHPNMKPLWRKAIGLKNEFRRVSFTHVLRSNSNIQRVDELANIALDGIEQTGSKRSESSKYQQICFVNKNFEQMPSKDKSFNDEGRRTYPGYLSKSEHERQRIREKEMVEGFLKFDKTVGETENFVIEIDKSQKTVLLKEKILTVECPFKLSMNPDEAKEIIKQIEKAVSKLAKK
jgi:ribonuclease HI